MLSIVLLLPLVGALGVLVLPRRAAWSWALALALADLGAALAVLAQFDAHASGFQLVEHVPWLPDLGINYALGVDGLNVFLIGLNALLTVIAIGASWNVARSGERPREYLVLLVLLSTGMQGVFLATNLFLFYVAWEVMLVPAYLLIGIFGGPRRAYAAIKFVLYTIVGSLLMLVGIIVVGAVVSQNSHAAYTLDLPALLSAGVPRGAQVLLFLAFFAAFAVKVGLFPFHSWVPDAYSEAPPAVAVLIAGMMAKTGAYGFVRYCLPLFPDASRQLAPLLEVLAVVGILYFALEALVAQDIKRLVAYVSISHMGVIILAIFALNAQGIEGGILQMVNHGIIVAALFLIAGAIEARTGTRRLADFGGLATRLPLLATVFLIVSLAALGLPGLNSFAGEFLAFLGTFHANSAFGALGTLVVIPAAWYMLRFFQGITEGSAPSDGPVAEALSGRGGGQRVAALRDLRGGELLVLAPLLLLIFILGIIPGAVTWRLESSVNALPPVHLAPRGSLAPAAVDVVSLSPGGPGFIAVGGVESWRMAQSGAPR